MQELSGKVAVVTGAASGIGLATATRFAEEGMRVVLADIEEAALDGAVQGLADAGHDVLGVRTDVSRWEEVERLAARAVDRYGAVHVLHNNAGVVVGGPIAELSLADWEWVLGVDLWSVIYGVKAFLPILKAQSEGHVINTSSSAGLVAAPTIAPYNVAKFGVVALTETLQRELVAEGSNVRASVLCPGAIDTRIVESARNRDAESAKTHAESRAEKQFQKHAGKLLKQRGLAPAAVADMVVEGMRKQEFWILTHADWKDVLRERVETLASTNQLSEGFGG
jgi:NAD(P)-dependent dehydrogenase (short-subunit alcohol dehydrogenase family)